MLDIKKFRAVSKGIEQGSHRPHGGEDQYHNIWTSGVSRSAELYVVPPSNSTRVTRRVTAWKDPDYLTHLGFVGFIIQLYCRVNCRYVGPYAYIICAFATSSGFGCNYNHVGIASQP
jgi:hypothetical protein